MSKTVTEFDNSQVNCVNRKIQTQGRTQSWIAKSLSVSNQTVSSWSNNHSQPSLEYLHKLANLLGLKPSQLIDDTYKPEAND